MYSVFVPFICVRASLCAYIRKHCEHDIAESIQLIFTKLTPMMHYTTKINTSNFGIKVEDHGEVMRAGNSTLQMKAYSTQCHMAFKSS